MRSFLPFLVVTAFVTTLSTGCGYNSVIDKDEAVKAAWAEVGSQYQRRADLVPNLVATVKGAANFEEKTLTEVLDARSSALAVRVDPSIVDDPARLKQFEDSQQRLGGALSHLIAVSEAYPDLKATAAYRDLMAQLEGTENRIAVARGRYIQAVADYNILVQRFPTSIGASIRGRGVRPTFSPTAAGSDVPPKVSF
jgi:LemA protein